MNCRSAADRCAAAGAPTTVVGGTTIAGPAGTTATVAVTGVTATGCVLQAATPAADSTVRVKDIEGLMHVSW